MLVPSLHATGPVKGAVALANQLKAQSPANVAVMNDVEQSLGAYRKAFDEFVSLSQAKDLALEMASWSVSSVANNLDVLLEGWIYVPETAKA